MQRDAVQAALQTREGIIENNKQTIHWGLLRWL